MEMRNYLTETFRFNDLMNQKLLAKIGNLPDQVQCIRLFSHLINSQNKWFQRIVQYPKDPMMDWWEPAYVLSELGGKWEESLKNWLEFIDGKSEQDLNSEVKFIGFDGSEWAARLKDIALQLNYHSIHHRAQMQVFIRQQGLEPDFVDYIGTAYRKIR